MTPLCASSGIHCPTAAPQLLTVACQPFAPTIPFHFSSHSHPILSLASHPPPSGSHPILLHQVLIPSSYIRFSTHYHPIFHQVLIPSSSIGFSSHSRWLSVSCLVSRSLSLLCLSVFVSVSVLGAPCSSFLLASVSYVGSFSLCSCSILIPLQQKYMPCNFFFFFFFFLHLSSTSTISVW